MMLVFNRSLHHLTLRPHVRTLDYIIKAYLYIHKGVQREKMGRQGNPNNTQSRSWGLDGPESLCVITLQGVSDFCRGFALKKKPNGACRRSNRDVTVITEVVTFTA